MRLLRFASTVGTLAGLLTACSGESSDFNDGGGGDESGGSAGSQGGSNSKGGSGPSGGTTATGGSGTGGSATGGSATGGSATGGSSTGGKGGSATGGTGGMGGEPPDGVCEDITPCGGDPTGSWNVTENCTEILIPIFTDPGCEDVLAHGAATLEGTMTFADGMLTQDTTSVATVTVTITDACAQGIAGSPDVDAALMCPLIDAELANQPDTTGSCVAGPEGCRCDLESTPMTTMQTDTYVVMGNQIVLGSSTEPFDFCVDGDELHLHGNAVDVDGSSVALTLLLERI